MRKLVLMLSIWLVFAPTPPGVALNHETRECAGYWAGDEFKVYTLPAGWQDYYPAGGIIETEAGSCRFEGPSSAYDAQCCCRELGYRYVESPVGPSYLTPNGWSQLAGNAWPALALAAVFLLPAVTAAVWFSRRSRKTNA